MDKKVAVALSSGWKRSILPQDITKALAALGLPSRDGDEAMELSVG